jgi:hypothetical protein
MSNYRKTMASALQEMYSLDESVIDKVKEIDSKKSAAKIDGVMVDSFTASAISQIYDKVNDANKKKMEKLPIIKLANLAMKMMQKNDYVPEEVDLDEGTKQVLAHGGKGKYKVTKDGDKIEIKFGGKVVGTADFDRGADSFFVSIKGEKGQKSFDDAQAIADYFAKNKITEEVDLDEDFSVEVPKQKIAGKTYGGGATVIVKAKTAYQAIKMVAKRLDVDVNLLKTGKVVKEEADLDEGLGVAEDVPAMEVGTDRYREYAVGLTPGENAEFAAAQDFKVASMKEALAKVWGLDEKTLDKTSKEDYDEEDEELKPVKGSKTMTGGKVAKVNTKPKIG